MDCYLFPVQFLGWGETPEEAWRQGLEAFVKAELNPEIKYFKMAPVENEAAGKSEENPEEGKQS
jgi:hypothetical protein